MDENELIKELLNLKGYAELKDAQKIALGKGLLKYREDFIVIAPTATGKTFTAELAMYQALKRGEKVLYLVPSLALVKEKADEFQYLSKNGYRIYSAGIENAWETADVLILTFESFFVQTLSDPTRIKRYSFAVFDEFHILYDAQRGVNLEKSIILATEFGLRTLCLSATFEDKNEIAGWLDAQVITVPESAREVKLEEKIIYTEGLKSKNKNEAVYKRLIEDDKTPCLIFCSTKPRTMRRAKEMVEFISNYYSTIIPDNLDLKFDNIKEELFKVKKDKDLTENETELCRCLSYQVGFHNALLDEDVRNFVAERLLKNKVKWLFTTTTLAYGINTPTRSVVIFDKTLYNYTQNRSVPMPVWMYDQMKGRAGRPQYYVNCVKEEKTAYVYVVAGSGADAEKIRTMYFEGRLERAVSYLGCGDHSQKTILQLIYAGRNHWNEITRFFERSLNAYQARQNPFATYDLAGAVKGYVFELLRGRFIEDTGGGGYRLTSLGKLTAQYLSFSNKNKDHSLSSFVAMYGFASKNGLNPSFETLLFVCKILEVWVSPKNPRSINEIILNYFSSMGIEKVKNSDVAAFVLWHGWIDNETTKEIEKRYEVYADNLQSVASEAAEGMILLEKMHQSFGKETPKDFVKLRNRVKHGVRDTQVRIVAYNGFKRTLAKDLLSTAVSIIDAERQKGISSADFLKNSDLLDFYLGYYKKYGKDVLKEKLISYSLHFGEKRSERFLSILDELAREHVTKRAG